MERFPLTHQSVLERIRSGDDTIRHGAFSDLVTGYWRPSYHYLRLHWRLSPDDAEDIIQGFFTVAFEKGYLEKFDPAKARFRTFLRTCLDRFLQNQRKAETALKRGGAAEILSLDFPGAEQELPLVSTDLRDLDRFFRDYKGLEGKKGEAVEVGDMYGYLQALEVIRKSRNAYDRGEGR